MSHLIRQNLTVIMIISDDNLLDYGSRLHLVG